MITAIKSEDYPAALVALRAGANANAHDHSDESPLSRQAQWKRFFLRIFRPANQPLQEDRPTALYLLFKPKTPYDLEESAGKIQLVKALLDAGADPNTTEPTRAWRTSRVSVLMLTANHDTPQSFRLLLTHGANVHLKDATGAAALNYAAGGGDADLVQLLLDAGADIEGKGDNGWTPLHNACIAHSLTTAEVLLRNHADINARDKKGETPLDWTKENPPLRDLLRQAGGKTGDEIGTLPAP